MFDEKSQYLILEGGHVLSNGSTILFDLVCIFLIHWLSCHLKFNEFHKLSLMLLSMLLNCFFLQLVLLLELIKPNWYLIRIVFPKKFINFIFHLLIPHVKPTFFIFLSTFRLLWKTVATCLTFISVVLQTLFSLFLFLF